MRFEKVGQLGCQVAQVLIEQCTIVARKMELQIRQRVPGSSRPIVDFRCELIASAKCAVDRNNVGQKQREEAETDRRCGDRHYSGKRRLRNEIADTERRHGKARVVNSSRKARVRFRCTGADDPRSKLWPDHQADTEQQQCRPDRSLSHNQHRPAEEKQLAFRTENFLRNIVVNAVDEDRYRPGNRTRIQHRHPRFKDTGGCEQQPDDRTQQSSNAAQSITPAYLRNSLINSSSF